MMIVQKIDLGETAKDGKVHNLAGKERGISARSYFKLDQLEQEATTIDVIVPEYLDTVSTSYFLGLFSPSVKHMGIEGFKKKYKFIADDVLLTQINHGIRLSESLTK
jgi:hypothetical protein